MFTRHILTRPPWRLFSPTRPTDCLAIDVPGCAFGACKAAVRSGVRGTIVTELSLSLAVSVAQIAAVMGVVMLTVMILTLDERKVPGRMQDRMGTMEVAPYGILQQIAD